MTQDEMLTLYNDGKTYAQIAKLAKMDRHKVSRLVRAAGGQSRSPSARRMGTLNPAWKGGRWVTERGYVMLRVDGRYEYEHRLVMAAHLGRDLLTEEHVHHENEDKGDNRIENLALTTNADHRHEHHQLTRWARDYDACVSCGETEHFHRGHGLCAGCHHLHGTGETRSRASRSRVGWARDYDCCQSCGTTARRHGGFGLCSGCKAKKWRKEHAA